MTETCPTSSRTRHFLCASLILFTVVIVILLPILLVNRPRAQTVDDGKWKPECPVEFSEGFGSVRIDCHPDPGVTEARCKGRGCCWVPLPFKRPVELEKRIPLCIYPGNFGYVATGNVEAFVHGWQVRLTRQEMPSRYGDDLQVIVVRVEYQTPTRLRIKFFDQGDKRFEVPLNNYFQESENYKNPFDGKLYEVSYNKDNKTFHLRVRRSSNEVVIFDTSVGGLIFSDRFLELTTKLTTRNVYGFTGKHFRENNENHLSQDFAWWTWNLFSTNAKPDERRHSHGVQPMYLCLEKDGKAHAVLFLNSYPMDVVITPTPAVTFRTIGGVLDFYLFLGPTPDDIMRQYTEVVGRPFMPSYWSLGLQLLLPKLKDIDQGLQAIEFMRNNSLFFESIILDADHSLSPASLAKLYSHLRKNNQHVVLTVNPGIVLDNLTVEEKLRMRILVKDSITQSPLYTQTQSGIVNFPDFVDGKITKWWNYNLMRLYNYTFSGLKLDGNEPTTVTNGSVNDCIKDYYNYPPYLTRIKGKTLYENTLCMDSIHKLNGEEVRHIQVHNLYGYMMTKATEEVLSKKRFLILSRSTFIGSGKYGGHWFGEYSPKWNHMTWTVPAMLEYNIFGIPYVGASICGDKMKSDSEFNSNLCSRWFQLGMFYPFCYLTYPFGILKPTLKSDKVLLTARRALRTRITLLPYLYTLFHLAHVNGSAVVRPLFYEFPKDNLLSSLDKQFLFGPALLVTPVLDENRKIIYLPAGIWYDFYTKIKLHSGGKYDKFDDRDESINLHIRGGYIIPTHTSFNYTSRVRKEALHLIVALNEDFQAEGSFYFDDGITKDSYKLKEFVFTTFFVQNDTLTVSGFKGKPILSNYFSGVNFTSVDVLGLAKKPDHVIIGNKYLIPKEEFNWDSKSQTLEIRGIIIPITDKLQIQWKWIN